MARILLKARKRQLGCCIIQQVSEMPEGTCKIYKEKYLYRLLLLWDSQSQHNTFAYIVIDCPILGAIYVMIAQFTLG